MRNNVCGILVLFNWLGAIGLAVDAQSLNVISPDGANVITLDVSPELRESPLRYSIARGNRAVVKPSRLGLRFGATGSIADRAALVGVDRGEIDDSFSLPWGKSAAARDRCRWLKARFASASLQWELELRAYDDGVAFRYLFPAQPQLTAAEIVAEETAFELADSAVVHFMTCKNFRTDHENEYQRLPLADLPTGKLIDLPALAVWPDLAAAVTEARIRDFPGLYVERAAASSAWRCRLSPLPAPSDACAVCRPPFSTPWRVVLLADRAGKLIESNLLLCLNDPPTEDYSWARPGKTTWHWWNGDPGMDFATHQRYIDFCADHGIAYHAVVADDRPWHVQSRKDFAPGPDTDILTPRPELELPRILAYAKDKNVGIRLWAHWKPLAERLDAAFAQYQAWGVQGLMIDFLDRDDQEMVNFCQRALESAARHHLHIQFHGSYKPSGEQRTFPHLFNREGVLNLEYLKWSKRCTPPHNVGVAYTRLLAGPLDYHLGGFRSAPRDAFSPRNEDPFVLGTRCHQLAMYVVYENPMPMIADAPQAYEGQVGFDFVAQAPTTWDQTRFLAGEPGEYVVVARRKGDRWYVGGMTNWTARELALPLEFLDAKSYQLVLYQDGSRDESNPNAIRRDERQIACDDDVCVDLAPGGGFAAVFTPN